ncbi:hypothetical protein Agub_g15512, partial [Astrephomene gubernaculifera]
MGNLSFVNEYGVQGDGGPTHAMATDGTFLAYALPGGPTVEVRCLRPMSTAPVRLQSGLQELPVLSLCIGSGHMGTSDPSPSPFPGSSRGPAAAAASAPTLLFCGSSDSVVAWNLTGVYDAVARGHPPPPAIQVMSGQGPVFALGHSSRLSLLVVCAGQDVHVFDVHTFRHVYRLDGHTADVLAASFCPPPASPHLLVTAGADRTFKIWDLQAGSLVVQSAVLGPAPLTCLALEPSQPPRLVLGAADGTLRFFDLSSLPAARLLQTVDVGRQVNRAMSAAAAAAAAEAAAAAAGPKVISSRPAWKAAMGLQRQPSGSYSDLGGGDGDEVDEDGDRSEGLSNTYILQLAYAAPPPPPSPPPGAHAAHMLLPDILGPPGQPPPLLLPACPSLLVAMPGALSVLDTRSYDVVEAFLLGRPEPAGAAAAAAGAGVVSGRQRPDGSGVVALGGGALAAPPPPPPTLRPRLALRGVPRAEPCGCVAFAPTRGTGPAEEDA